MGSFGSDGRRLERFLKWQDYAVNCSGTYYGYCYSDPLPNLSSAPFAQGKECEKGSSNTLPYYYGCTPDGRDAFVDQVDQISDFCEHVPACANQVPTDEIPTGL